MSAYNFINITRSKAKQFMINKMISDVTDDELESFMNDFLHDQLLHCTIISDNDDRERYDDYL